MVEHQVIAPCIPVWKTGVYLATPMLGEMEVAGEIEHDFRVSLVFDFRRTTIFRRMTAHNGLIRTSTI
jgi:hypothetical protein